MWLLSPLSWMLCCLLLLAWAWPQRAKRPRLVQIAGCLLGLSVLAMTPMLGNLLLSALESPASIAPTSARCYPERMRDAVVLGGGIDRLPANATDIAVLSVASRRRAERAAQWWHQLPGRQLWVAGGPPAKGYPSESQLLSLYLQTLGVPASAIQQEPRSRNTWANAHYLATMLAPPPKQVVLVTSAVHMRRAVFAMTQAGFEVCPLETDYRQEPFQLPGYLIPQSSALEKTEAAMHELVGMAYYRLRAWFD